MGRIDRREQRAQGRISYRLRRGQTRAIDRIAVLDHCDAVPARSGSIAAWAAMA